MPFLTPEAIGERDTLATFAAQQLHQVAIALQGLTDEQLRATPSASRMSLGALARHCLLIAEQAAARIADVPEADAVGPRTAAQLGAEGTIAPDALREGDSADSLITALNAAADALADAIRGADPDSERPVPDEPWFAGRTAWTVRWYAMHQVEEVARHAGHADILRESIDGQIAYALNARADGQPWPPEEW